MTKDNPIFDVFKGAAKGFCDLLFNQTHDAIFCLDRERKIVIWNKSAEAVTGFDRTDVIGKRCPEDIGLFVDREGQPLNPQNSPILSALNDGTVHAAELYIRHKEGFRLPILLRAIPIFSEDGKTVGMTGIFINMSPKVTIPMNVNDLERMVLIDGETGITNKKYLEMHLAARLEEYQKYNLSFGVIYVDVDNYDKIMERFGRFNTAKVLRMIARTLFKNIRYFDIVGRWSTEEFLVVLLNIDEGRLDNVANKLRLLVSESYISVETGVLNATVSMGACLVQRYDSVESLVKRAEQLMMHSKWLGRNKVSLSFIQGKER